MENASPESIFSIHGQMCTRANSLGLSQERIDGIKHGVDPEFWNRYDRLMRGEYKDAIVTNSITATPITRVVVSEIDDWKAFYKKFFSCDVDLGTVGVPKGLDRTIFIAKGISINMAVKAHIDRNIPFWKYCDEDLESVMRESERGPVKGSYAIRVRKGQEADHDLRKLSADDIAAKGIHTESVLERLIHGLKYYDETKKHLDMKNVTLCASSRFTDGNVPYVRRHDDGDVMVHWSHPRACDPNLGARRVVQ